MRLLIIRHGESEADRLHVHEGRADFELTELGQQQAIAMSTYIAQHYSVCKIYSSTLKRAMQTAQYLSTYSACPIIEHPMLMEFNNGIIAGMDKKVAAEEYPVVYDLPLHTSVYGQESKLEFRFRAEYVLSEIIAENNHNDTIAIISHGGMINQLYHALLNLPVDSNIVFPTGNTGIHEWLINAGHRSIVKSNQTSHLYKI